MWDPNSGANHGTLIVSISQWRQKIPIVCFQVFFEQGVSMKQLNTIDWVALVLLIIGGINWGLVGFFTFDLVAAIFGPLTAMSRIIYGLVGISAVYVAFVSPAFSRKSAPKARHAQQHA